VNPSYSHLLGQPLRSVLTELSDELGCLSDMDGKSFASISAVTSLTPTGQTQYENVLNAIIHDIYLDDDVLGSVIRLEGVDPSEIEKLSDDYSSHLEAEEKMWYLYL